MQSFFRFDKLGRSFGCVGGLIIAVAERCLILLPLTKYDISEIMISKQPSQENIYISIVLDLSSGTVNRIAWHGVEFNPSLMMMK